MAESDLQKRLERLGEQLVTDIERWEQRTRGDRAKALDQLTHTLEGKLEKAFTKLAEEGAKHEARARRREEQREARRARRTNRPPPSVAGGVVFLVAATICAVIGVLNPQLWWMVFVALGLGLSGAGQLGSAARRRKELAAQTPAPLPEPTHEVDALCDQLLADLAQSPEPVRRFISDPEQTVASLRSTLRSLDLRRKQLSAEQPGAQREALATRRREIEARQASTTDPVTRSRMDEALRSLALSDQSLAQLEVMSERVDGEYTSLLIHLQELKTRVALARSSAGTTQLDEVRQSVRRLDDELHAISEALAAVERGELQPVVDVGGNDAPREPRRVRE